MNIEKQEVYYSRMQKAVQQLDYEINKLYNTGNVELPDKLNKISIDVQDNARFMNDCYKTK